MNKTRYFNRDGDEIDEHNALDGMILRDGMTARVPLPFRDSLRPNNLRISAADGTAEGLHRPGFRVNSDSRQRNERQKANDQYQYELTNAWRGKDAAIEPVSKMTGTGSGEFRAQPREGDVCTINGSPGHINAEGKCVVDKPNWPGQRAKLDAQTRDAAYAEYDQEISNAWRMR